MPAHAELSRPPRSQAQFAGLVVFGAAVALVALVGGLAASGSREEYASLDRPPWAPPGWLFGPVWAFLYVTVALAGWLVWRRVGASWPLVPYVVQLVLNAAWTPIFFAAGAYGLAAVEIVVLWGAIAATVVAFWRIQRGAAALLLPCWAWVTYAATVNIAIWWTNR